MEQRSFSNLSITSPTLQLILQPLCCFTYVTAHSPTISLLHQHHSSFSNPSFASPTSQALHLRHLASCPCYEYSSILLFARTRKVFTILPIPAVAFKETTNSPSPPYSLHIFSWENSLNLPNRLQHQLHFPVSLSCSIAEGHSVFESFIFISTSLLYVLAMIICRPNDVNQKSEVSAALSPLPFLFYNIVKL